MKQSKQSTTWNRMNQDNKETEHNIIIEYLLANKKLEKARNDSDNAGPWTGNQNFFFLSHPFHDWTFFFFLWVPCLRFNGWSVHCLIHVYFSPPPMSGQFMRFCRCRIRTEAARHTERTTDHCTKWLRFSQFQVGISLRHWLTATNLNRSRQQLRGSRSGSIEGRSGDWSQTF